MEDTSHSRMRFWVSGVVLLTALIPHAAGARSLEAIQTSGQLHLAIRDGIPPIQYKDRHGRWTGIDGDLGLALAQHLGVTPVWTEVRTPAEREEVLQRGVADIVISSFSVTEDRLTRLAFSNPYMHTGLALMIRRSAQRQYRTARDLDGHTIAVTEGSTGATVAPQILPQASLVRVSTVPETYTALRDGQATAILNDEIFLRTYAASHPEFVVLDGLLSADVYAIGMHQADTSLHEAVNAWLALIKQHGTLQAILERHLAGGTQSRAEAPGSPIGRRALAGATAVEVQPGDTLGKLAMGHYGNPALWPSIYAANRDVVTFASVLRPGWRLRLPALAQGGARREAPGIVRQAGLVSRQGTKPLPQAAAKPACPQMEGQLRRLKGLYEQGLISDPVYQERQHRVLRCLSRQGG